MREENGFSVKRKKLNLKTDRPKMQECKKLKENEPMMLGYCTEDDTRTSLYGLRLDPLVLVRNLV